MRGLSWLSLEPDKVSKLAILSSTRLASWLSIKLDKVSKLAIVLA
jgi:hypothetical protein